MKTTPHKPKRYSVRFDTEKFMADVEAQRDRYGLIWADVSHITGASAPMLAKLARGAVSAPGGHILASLLHWLGKTDLNEYMIRSDLNDKEGA